MRLSGVVVCQNNAATIGPVVRSLAPCCDEIIVVDGGSDDETVEIAAPCEKVRLFQRDFETQATQKNFACDQALGDWILILDSDELLSAAGLRRLRRLTHVPGAHWFSFPRYWLVEQAGRLYYLAGRPYYRDRQLRLFRNEPGFRYDEERHPIHHEFQARRGFGRPLRSPHIFHYALLLNEREERERKFRRYMEIEPASERINRQQLWEDQAVPLRPLPESPPGMLGPRRARIQATPTACGSTRPATTGRAIDNHGQSEGGGRMGERRRPGVQLPEETSGSALLYRILEAAATRHLDVFGGPQLLGDPRRFRSRFAERLVQFELRRVASAKRVTIAREMLACAQEQLRFVGERGDEPLAEHLARPAAPLALEEVRLLGAGRLTPRVEYAGYSYAGGRLAHLAEELLARAHASRAACDALRWLAQRFAEEPVDLGGHRFAILGAGAELSPVPLLLEAGADVLWIDLAEPPADLVKDTQLSGRLFFPPGGANLLERPAEIAASIAAFAEGSPLHVGLYAYAPGQCQEWRLAAAMNAIVRSLPAGTADSVSLFTSPTTPAAVQPEDQQAASQRLADAPAWQRALRSAGRLSDGHARRGDACIARAVVRIQGASYQAAQYLAKMLASEVWAVYGNDLGDGGPPLRASANTAGVTRTRSLSMPIFEAGFLGGPAFGVDTFAPAATRWLNGLLLLHDLLNDAAPARQPGLSEAERARRLHAQQVHGGIFSLPYALEPTLTAAALIGFGRRPRLLLDLLRR